MQKVGDIPCVCVRVCAHKHDQRTDHMWQRSYHFRVFQPQFRSCLEVAQTNLLWEACDLQARQTQVKTAQLSSFSLPLPLLTILMYVLKEMVNNLFTSL